MLDQVRVKVFTRAIYYASTDEFYQDEDNVFIIAKVPKGKEKTGY